MSPEVYHLLKKALEESTTEARKIFNDSPLALTKGDFDDIAKNQLEIKLKEYDIQVS